MSTRLIPKHHVLFSVEQPRHPITLAGAPTTEEVVQHLNSTGENAEIVHGQYGGVPEKSIMVSNPKNMKGITDLATGLGQDSLLHSKNGQHELHFLNGDNKGQHYKGSGSTVHPLQPEDNWTKLHTVDGPKFVQHNIDFGTMHPTDRIIKSEDLNKSEDHGLCAMFLFKGVDHPDILHVTHKYFGKEFDDESGALEVIKKYFKEEPFKPFTVEFNNVEYFGKDKDVKVLRPSSEDKKKFLLPLKEQLDELIPDKFPVYKPHASVSANVDSVNIELSSYALVRGGTVVWCSDDSLIKAEVLTKMSRPKIAFPNFKKLSTRPDQEVQLLENARQKSIFGLKVANTEMRHVQPGKVFRVAGSSKTHTKESGTKAYGERIANAFDRNTLGVNYNSEDGPKSASVAGKLRSKFEGGDEAHQAKLKAHVDTSNAMILAHNAKTQEWRSKAYDLSNKVHEPGGKEAYDAHIGTRPEKLKLPRKPSAPKVDTVDLSPEAQALRGKAVDATIQHEGLHHSMAEMERHYGKAAARTVHEGMLQQFAPNALEAVGAFINKKLGYKTSSPKFTEEILAHSRDILVNPAKRNKFKEAVGAEKFDGIIKDLKIGHQKAYEYAKNLKPSDVGAKESDQSDALVRGETTIWCSDDDSIKAEVLNKAPLVHHGDYSDMPDLKQLDPKKYESIHESTLPNGVIYNTYRSKTSRPQDRQHIHTLTHPQTGDVMAELKTSRNIDDFGQIMPNTIEHAHVDPGYRGYGIGRQLYLATGLKHGRLHSDDKITPESHNAWKSFQDVPGVKVKLGRYEGDHGPAESRGEEAAYQHDRHILKIDANSFDKDKAFPDVPDLAIRRKQRVVKSEELEKVELVEDESNKVMFDQDPTTGESIGAVNWSEAIRPEEKLKVLKLLLEDMPQPDIEIEEQESLRNSSHRWDY